MKNKRKVVESVLSAIMLCTSASSFGEGLNAAGEETVFATFSKATKVETLSIQTFEREVPVSEYTLRCRLNPRGGGLYEANAFLLTEPEPRSVFTHDSVHIRVSDADNPPVSATETCRIIENALADAQNNGGILAQSVTITLKINYFRSGNVCSRSLIEVVQIPLGEGRIVLNSPVKGKGIAPTDLAECDS